MAKKKKQECPAGERWAVPYADFLSLLLALFIALWALSTQNESKVEALKLEFIKIFDSPPKPDTLQPIMIIPPPPGDIEETSDGVKPNAEQSSAAVRSTESVMQIDRLTQEGGVLEQIEHGVTLRLPSDLLFERDSAKITSQEMRDYIRNIANIIKQFPPHVHVNVRGYTDDSAIPPSSGYSDHFTLAAARAFAVMEMLIQDGVNPKMLSFTSYGKNQPLVPNSSLANRSKNNRVDLFLMADPSSVKNIQSLLDRVGKK